MDQLLTSQLALHQDLEEDFQQFLVEHVLQHHRHHACYLDQRCYVHQHPQRMLSVAVDISGACEARITWIDLCIDCIVHKSSACQHLHFHPPHYPQPYMVHAPSSRPALIAVVVAVSSVPQAAPPGELQLFSPPIPLQCVSACWHDGGAGTVSDSAMPHGAAEGRTRA